MWTHSLTLALHQIDEKSHHRKRNTVFPVLEKMVGSLANTVHQVCPNDLSPSDVGEQVRKVYHTHVSSENPVWNYGVIPTVSSVSQVPLGGHECDTCRALEIPGC